jgi:chemotaxis response regulator CheB
MIHGILTEFRCLTRSVTIPEHETRGVVPSRCAMSRRQRKSSPGRGESEGKTPGAFVVALGASAGGLEAIEEFLSHLPASPGFSLVVLQHLDPSHPSML